MPGRVKCRLRGVGAAVFVAAALAFVTGCAEFSPGTREEPVPIGRFAEVGDWLVGVGTVDTDAYESMAAEHEFAVPPPPGSQYVLLMLDIVNRSDYPRTFLSDVTYEIQGSGGDVFEAGETSLVPPAWWSSAEVQPGEQSGAVVAVAVPSDQIEGALLVIEKRAGLTPDRTYFVVEHNIAE